MKKFGLFIITLLCLTGCQSNQTVLRKMLALNDTLIYQNIEQGHFQETLFRAEFYTGIDININLFQQYPGNFTPLAGVALQDASSSQYISVKYLVEDSGIKLVIEQSDGEEPITSTAYPFSSMESTIHMSWTEEHVAIRAGRISDKVKLSFSPALISQFASSSELVSRIKLQER